MSENVIGRNSAAPRYLQWAGTLSQEDVARAQLHAIERMDDLGATIGQAGIKLLVLINGGAAAAALAFVGALFTKAPPIAFWKLVAVASTLEWFALGVLLAGISFVFGYLAGYFTVLRLNSFEPSDRAPWIAVTPWSRRFLFFAVFCHAIGTLLAVLSLIFFVSGLFALQNAVSALDAVTASSGL